MKALNLSYPGPRAVRAGIVLAGIAWLPPLALSFAQGVATATPCRLPFLYDPAAYTRLLIAVPLFVVIGPLIDHMLGLALRTMVGAGIVPRARRAGFDAAVRELDRGREAWLPELILIAGSLLLIWLGSQRGTHSKLTTWAAVGTPPHLTWAGLWFAFVSLPLFLVLAGRWGWRLILWARLLWRVSKLDLDLVPAHPDGLGGLGLLSRANAALGLVIVPVSVTLAANAVTRVRLEGESLMDMKILLGVYVVLAIVLTQAPLLAFSTVMRRAKLEGMVAMGLLAERYSRDFDRKWIPRLHPLEAPEPPDPNEKLLGSADIQSLADMGNSFNQVMRMRPVLLEVRMLGVVAAITVLPMAPLLAMIIPLKDAFAKLAHLLM
jgi:hypothetical protein